MMHAAVLEISQKRKKRAVKLKREASPKCINATELLYLEEIMKFCLVYIEQVKPLIADVDELLVDNHT
jgi:hypothetical protein